MGQGHGRVKSKMAAINLGYVMIKNNFVMWIQFTCYFCDQGQITRPQQGQIKYDRHYSRIQINRGEWIPPMFQSILNQVLITIEEVRPFNIMVNK